MATTRFYIPNLGLGETALPDDQDHHARHVLRMRDGETVIAFNGRGFWATGRLVIGRRESCFITAGPLRQDLPPRVRVTVASATPKADRAMQMVEQLSQIGVQRLVWLNTEFAVVHPDKEGGKMAKFRRAAAESAKQCGRNFVMEIDGPVALVDLLSQAGADTNDFLWGQPTAEKSIFEWLIKTADLKAAVDGHISTDGGKPASYAPTVLIGPEGGWSDTETRLLSADHRVHAVRLTSTVLRMETAAVVAAAIISCAAGN